MNQYLSTWLGEPFSDRWARTILAEEEVRRYNKGDVIMVQEERTRGFVYLILTGYCDVVMHDGEDFQVIASLQAGEIIGEMAVVTGTGKRNASVVASSPVTVMIFSEENFNEFVIKEGYRDKLLMRWQMRKILKTFPQFDRLISTVLEKISELAVEEKIPAGQQYTIDEDCWTIFHEGSAKLGDRSLVSGYQMGNRPYSNSVKGTIAAETDCSLVRFTHDSFVSLLASTPQLNYLLRKYRIEQNDPGVDWLLGEVSTY